MMPTFRFVTLPPGLLPPRSHTVSAGIGQVKRRKPGLKAKPRRAPSICHQRCCGVGSRLAFAVMKSKAAHKKAEIEDHPVIVQAVLARSI
jgi:hypothetical protein